VRAPLLAVLVLGLATVPATAAEPSPCQLGGPAGTASVVRVDLPHGSPSLALRVTSPTTPTAASAAGTRASWHLATQVAVVRVGTGSLVASRVVQSGSSPRAVALSAQGRDVRQDTPGPAAPFVHAAAAVPPYLAAGRYLLVAYGTDGSPALPNPGWSAEASFGTEVTCVPLRVRTSLVDRDQTTFTGGTQLTAYGAGTGTGGTTTWRSSERYVVGFGDAATQAVGQAHLRGVLPRRRVLDVRDGLRAFSGTSGTYAFTADWSGAFPLVLVCALGFTA
jgi:hypothetical protein